MKNNKLKDIFKSDISAGDSVQENWHALESEALGLDFMDDALDLVSDKEVANLEKCVNAKLEPQPSNFLNYYISIAVFIGLGFLSYLVLSFPGKKETNLKQVTLASNTLDAIPNRAKQANYSRPSIRSRVSQLTAVNEVGVISNRVVYSEMPLSTVSEIPLIENPVELTKHRRQYDFRYLRNFKVLNFETKKIDNDFRFLSGTPAYTSNVELDRDQEQVIEFHYYRKLERALYLMSKGKYERSLTLFTALKYLFPKDQNTLFYSGLVYYKNGDFGYAMHCWARLLAIENSFFHEEAKWYQALALCNLKKFDKAKIALTHVVEEDGFYKKQATLKLSEID